MSEVPKFPYTKKLSCTVGASPHTEDFRAEVSKILTLPFRAQPFRLLIFVYGIFLTFDMDL